MTDTVKKFANEVHNYSESSICLRCTFFHNVDLDSMHQFSYQGSVVETSNFRIVVKGAHGTRDIRITSGSL